jgi:hypothetical protein
MIESLRKSMASHVIGGDATVLNAAIRSPPHTGAGSNGLPAAPAPRIDLGGLVAEPGMRRHPDALSAVDRHAHVLLTRGGERLPYDVAIIATGARSIDVVPGAVTFRGPIGSGGVEGVIARAEREPGLRLVFAVPDADIAIVTPEKRPLQALGAAAADAAVAAVDRGVATAAAASTRPSRPRPARGPPVTVQAPVRRRSQARAA